jgi:ribosomal protein S18 acetylase RimI-like enzyme
VDVRPLADSDRDWVERLIVERWGAPLVVGRGRTWNPLELPGFAAFEGDRCIGVVTYEPDGDACEIVTIDALEEGRGVGTALFDAVVEAARAAGCERIRLVTTNNNLRALAFYQKRGFRLVALVPGAVDEARRVKASIPAVDSRGLPIRDELHLELLLDRAV